MITERIFLTGFMGSGKSTVAPRLARGLGYDVLDLDQEIVRTTGLSVPAIFELYGEERFRSEEKAQLHLSRERSNVVVSLGGGTIVDPDNLAWCLANGTVVYLRGSAAFLASRLANSKRDRPLLYDDHGKQLTANALRERVGSLLEQRKHMYEQAHIAVDIDASPVSKVARSIRDHIRSTA